MVDLLKKYKATLQFGVQIGKEEEYTPRCKKKVSLHRYQNNVKFYV